MNTFGLNRRGINIFGLLSGLAETITDVLIGDRIAKGKLGLTHSGDLEFVARNRSISVGSKVIKRKFTVRNR